MPSNIERNLHYTQGKIVMNVLNAYLIPTKAEIRQARDYVNKAVLDKLPSKTQLPVVGPLYTKIETQEKLNGYLNEANRDLNQHILELWEERDHYKNSADKLLEKLNDTIEELDLAVTMGGELKLIKDGRVISRGDNQTPMPPAVHDGWDAMDIEPKSSLISGTAYENRKQDQLPKIELIAGSAPVSPWPRDMRPSKEDLKEILKSVGAKVEDVPDPKLMTEYDKARTSEAGRIKAMVSFNHALNIKATNNEHRVLAEIAGKVPETRTCDMAVKNTLRYGETGINGENDFDGRTMKPLPSNVKELVIEFYDNNRMRMRLFDHDGNLLNPSVEDEVEDDTENNTQAG